MVNVQSPNNWEVDSHPIIAAAITEAGAGGTVVLSAGDFKITEPIVPLSGQTIVGAGMLSTNIIIDFSHILNFPNMSAIRKNEVAGTCVNPDVTVSNLCINGGRSQSGFDNYVTDPVLCPYGYGGGVSLGVNWTVTYCRVTNVNGPKMGCFEAHGSRIEYCLWDNDNGGTGGDQDNIGGGSVSGLQIVKNVFKENCAGSGIDITTGSNIYIRGNSIGFRSLILEGIQGGVVKDNIVYRSTVDQDAGSINIKSNSAYASAQQAGAWCSKNIVVESNTVVNSYSPGIIISSTWDDKGPGDALDAGKYGKASGIVVRGNSVYDAYGLGIYVGGQDRAIEQGHCELESNSIYNLRQATAGLGDEWNSGSGHFKMSGVGIGSGNGVIVQDTSVVKTKSAYLDPVNVVQDGARGGSNTAKSTRVSNANYYDLSA